MNLIVETDLGHDPDDFFTLCWLLAAGVDIKAIVITPGDLDQVAIANLLVDHLGRDIPIGVAKFSDKYSSGGIHHQLLKANKRSLNGIASGYGKDIIQSVWSEDCSVLVIGPATNIGNYIRDGGKPPRYFTMQGGFLPYSAHTHPVQRVPDFERQGWMPTFNMNGDKKVVDAICRADIARRQFCGKNVCHTILLTSDHLREFTPHDPASQLFMQAGRLYFQKHDEKKFHDPVAASCHLYPEIGVWVRGTPVPMKGGWTTDLRPTGDWVLADLHRKLFWETMYTFGRNRPKVDIHSLPR